LAWQEELRKLDEELAAGRIAAEEYRVRRDALLSSAAATGQQPPTSNSAESTQMITPITGGVHQQPQGPNADRTQVVSSSDSSADRTQIVSGDNVNSARTQAVRPGWQQVRPGDANWGQNIPGVPPQHGMPGHPMSNQGPPSAPGGFPAQQQQRWDAPSNDTGTPWGNSEFPPINQFGGQNWIKQGPEVFGESSSGSGKRIAIILAVIVVVLGLGTGAYFMFFNKHSGTTTATSTPPAATTTTPKPKDDLEIAALPGTTQDQSGISTFGDVVQGGLLTNDENKAYQTADATKVRLATSSLSGDSHISIMTAQTTSPTAAATAVARLVELQNVYGMQPYTGTTPDGVKINQIAKIGANPATIRAHYVHKGTVVRIQVDGPDLDTISTTFDQILTAQLKALPADD
jgi:hypothetical protein